MNKHYDKVGTSLVKRVCKICGKEVDAEILMNRRLTKKEADKINDLHGKVIGYTICDECKELKRQGFIFIGVDESKTDDIETPYRTGHIWVVSKESVDKILSDEVKEVGVAYIDINRAKRMGLPIN